MSISTDHTEQARALISLGFPALHARMKDVFEWLRDSNCPDNWIVSEFLLASGPTILPHVRDVLRGKDVDLIVHGAAGVGTPDQAGSWTVGQGEGAIGADPRKSPVLPR